VDLSPNEILRSLSAAKLRDRLDQVDQERKALLVLLRAARAQERQTKSAATPGHAEGGGR